MSDDILVDYARLCSWLRDWARWNASYQPNLGHKSHSVAISSNSSKTFDEMCNEQDHSAFVITDTAINDLAPAKCEAVRRHYGLCSVFRFPRENYHEMLVQGHAELDRSLKRRGIEV